MGLSARDVIVEGDRRKRDVIRADRADGTRNCWADNRTANGAAITSTPPALPSCASGGSRLPVPNPLTYLPEVPCASWNPASNPDPPGCTWFITPPEPAVRRRLAAAGAARRPRDRPAAPPRRRRR